MSQQSDNFQTWEEEGWEKEQTTLAEYQGQPAADWDCKKKPKKSIKITQQISRQIINISTF